jgi:hypothetical protein
MRMDRTPQVKSVPQYKEITPPPLGEGTRAELHTLSPRRRIERPAELSFRFSSDALIPRRSCMRVRTLGGQYFRAANG